MQAVDTTLPNGTDVIIENISIDSKNLPTVSINDSNATKNVENNSKPSKVVVNEPKHTVIPTKNAVKPINSASLTGNFSKVEYDTIVAPILNARVAAGVTLNANHFVRQMLDFIVNHKELLKTEFFALPENYKPTKLTTKGFFNK